MERVRVVSSNIISIGYDPATAVLEIEFKGGEVYQYTGVPQRLYDGMMRAESQGKYLNAHIRDAYPYRRAR